MSQASPLETVHKANGAKFHEDDGRRLPQHFGSPLDEYHAVRSGVGLMDLCDYSLLQFTGEDRVSFLQGMITNDVPQLAPGRGMFAAFADIHGKILADARIFCVEDAFFIELRDTLKNKIQAHLQKYLIADDVEIADLSGSYGIVSIQGPNSIQLVKRLLGAQDLPDQELSHQEFEWDGFRIRLVRTAHTGQTGLELWIPRSEVIAVARLIQEKGGVFSPRWIGTAAQEILRVEAGIPRYGVDMDDENLVLETNLEHAVNFTKGCYLGQEVIERIHSRGHVNRKLVGMILEGQVPAQRGDKVLAGDKEVGWVTSSLISPLLNRPVALGYVHKDYINPGTTFIIQGAKQPCSARVSPLPFSA